MLIQALVESPHHVCCRYRLRAFEPSLKAAGGDTIHFRRFPVSLFEPLLDHSLHPDLLILQRKLPNWWQRRKLNRVSIPIVFDFDDAVWLRDSYSPKGFHSTRRAGRFRRLMQSIDGVAAGNAFLAEEARRCNPALKIEWMPTCVDVKRYRVASHENPTPSLVWIGSASTLQGLERIRPVLEALGRAVPNLQLKQICDRFLRFDPLEVIETPWAEATETAEIASGDIGISWIPDDPWSRGKCGLKVLQYMAAGLPVVANPVGVHPEMIEHGVTGFLATTAEEWLDAVHQLVRDPDLRKRMGAAGRRVVEQRYSVEAGSDRWRSFLDSFLARRASA